MSAPIVAGGAVAIALAYLLTRTKVNGVTVASDTKLTDNITVADLTVSATADRLGLDNSLPESLLPNAERLASWLQGWWSDVGGFTINSGYRSDEVNDAVGGSSTSMHRKALAADVVPVSVSAAEFAQMVMDFGPSDLDQLIYYTDKGHVHIGLTTGTPRKQYMTSSGGAFTKVTTFEGLT